MGSGAHGVAPTKKTTTMAASRAATTTTTFPIPTVAGTGDTAAALGDGESKRLVPQGSNPLHN